MSSFTPVAALIKQIYNRSVTSVDPIRHQSGDWRGVYHVVDDSAAEWTARIASLSAAERLMHAAHVLDWLARQGYTAPRVAVPVSGEVMVGTTQREAVLLLSYVPGTVATPTPQTLYQLGRQIGCLHALEPSPDLPRSWWCPPAVFDQTRARLLHGTAHVPQRYEPLLSALLDVVAHLGAVLDTSGLIHGDCWYANAIVTPAGDTVLIDWDCAGLGPTILDLGSLLSTAHYDLTKPLHVEADEAKIRAIMEGYQAHKRIDAHAFTCFTEAIQFYIAFNAGRYLETADRNVIDEQILQKLQARFDASWEIAEIAARYCRLDGS